MKILPLLFGYIFQGSAGAGPISQTNICINECTGVASDWTNYSNLGIKIDGKYQLDMPKISVLNVSTKHCSKLFVLLIYLLSRYFTLWIDKGFTCNYVDELRQFLLDRIRK